MADLSAIPQDDIKALERIMRLMNVPGITVDGNADDIDATKALLILQKISSAVSLGADGKLVMGAGTPITPEQFTDPQQREAVIAQAQAAINALKISPIVQIVSDINDASTDVDYKKLEENLIDLRVSSDEVAGLKTLLWGQDSNFFQDEAKQRSAMLQTIITQAKGNPEFITAEQALGPRVFNNIPEFISALNDSDNWFKTLGAIGDATYPQNTGGDNDASAAAADLAEQTQAAQNQQQQQQQSLIVTVKTAIGITPPEGETLDGSWEAADKTALKAYLLPLQEADPTWLGHKNGVWSPKFQAHVAAHPDQYSGQAELFANLNKLSDQGHPLIADGDKSPTVNERKANVAIVEAGIRELIPILQGQLDEERTKAQGLIETIKTSGMSGLFIDRFALDTVKNSTIGQRMAKAGDDFVVRAIEGQLSHYHDLPDPDSLGDADGHLGLQEQRAIQGSVFLLATKFKIGIEPKWKYTPAMGEAFKTKLNEMSADDFAKLLNEEDTARYEALQGGARVRFLRNKRNEQKKQIFTLLEALDVLYESGMLADQQLYFAEEITIPEITKDIFADYVAENSDSPETLKLLNVMVSTYTQNIVDLTELVGAEAASIAGDIDPTLTIAEQFEGVYLANADLDIMLEMVDTLPLGEQERRDGYRAAIIAAHKAAQENPENAAAEFGKVMQERLEGLNEGENAHKAYFQFSRSRTAQIDPRMEPVTLMNGQEVTPTELLNLFGQQNKGKALAEGDSVWNIENEYHDPLYFQDENGDIYVAMIDMQSRVFRYDKIDPNVLNDADISPGLDLLYQRHDGIANWTPGNEKSTLAGRIIDAVNQQKELGLEGAAQAVYAKNNPNHTGLTGEFKGPANGDAPEDTVTPDPDPEPEADPRGGYVRGTPLATTTPPSGGQAGKP